MHTIKVQVSATFNEDALQLTTINVWSHDPSIHKKLNTDADYQYHQILTIMASAVVTSFIQVYKDAATREQAMEMYFKHIRLLLKTNESVDTFRMPEDPDKN